MRNPQHIITAKVADLAICFKERFKWAETILIVLRSRIECVQRCQQTANCLAVLHGPLSDPHMMCRQVHTKVLFKVGTILMMRKDVSSLSGVFAMIPVQEGSWDMDISATLVPSVETMGTTSILNLSPSASDASTFSYYSLDNSWLSPSVSTFSNTQLTVLTNTTSFSLATATNYSTSNSMTYSTAFPLETATEYSSSNFWTSSTTFSLATATESSSINPLTVSATFPLATVTEYSWESTTGTSTGSTTGSVIPTKPPSTVPNKQDIVAAGII
ncbi:hypothetical protein MAR_008596 [Mya arenaria]|uniref:Uncharacterized protein n=1 Tax=Mya arenaria TaxID=6604 RepID=A0ABY7DWD9_MYAAR|nr:hypothetical protein MAR_008596 [Mya arenaria]